MTGQRRPWAVGDPVWCWCQVEGGWLYAGTVTAVDGAWFRVRLVTGECWVRAGGLAAYVEAAPPG